jgi:hypothetical protein
LYQCVTKIPEGFDSLPVHTMTILCRPARNYKPTDVKEYGDGRARSSGLPPE